MIHLKRATYAASIFALLLALQALPGCLLQTPPSSSWATDVFKQRFSSLKPDMTTSQILDTMCARNGPRPNGHTDTYDLTEGYTVTLFYQGAHSDHPEEVVLHTPYATDATHWSSQPLSEADLAIGHPTTRPAR